MNFRVENNLLVPCGNNRDVPETNVGRIIGDNYFLPLKLIKAEEKELLVKAAILMEKGENIPEDLRKKLDLIDESVKRRRIEYCAKYK